LDQNGEMTTSLDDAIHNLGELVQLAASGEEVVITVDGRPTVRMTGVSASQPNDDGRAAWVAELQAAADAACVGAPKSAPQEFWDELRRDRL
jgi:prevent-host-death family protein